MPETENELKVKLVTMGRILERQGFFPAFGHLSVRVPGKEQFISTTGTLTDKSGLRVEDLITMDYQNRMVSGPKPPMESIIHAVLHRSREDAGCVVHAHPYYTVSLGISGIQYVPLTVQGCPFSRGLAIYEDPDLIVTAEQGEKFLKAAGQAKAILLRGHGSVVLDETIEGAMRLCLALEQESRRLLEMHGVKTLQPLTAAEVERNRSSGGGRVWEYYRNKLT